MNEMMEMALAFDDKNLPIKHIPVRPATRPLFAAAAGATAS